MPNEEAADYFEAREEVGPAPNLHQKGVFDLSELSQSVKPAQILALASNDSKVANVVYDALKRVFTREYIDGVL